MLVLDRDLVKSRILLMLKGVILPMLVLDRDIVKSRILLMLKGIEFLLLSIWGAFRVIFYTLMFWRGRIVEIGR